MTEHPTLIITQATIEATMKMMGWEQQRIGTTSRIRLDYEDYCGVCSSPCREYDVALGIPVCCAKCRDIAGVTA